MADHASAMYGFCGAFFSELRAAGVEKVVISPGARSAPLTITADRAGLDLFVQIDERSGGFFALGLAKATGGPVALVCTSGTAAANYLPAVIEAGRSSVPLLVLTADRPPELRGWGANQTIDQRDLYGRNVRWSAELPVASEGEPDAARRYAARAVAVATGRSPGPVHLNFPLRQPLRPEEGLAMEFPPPARPIHVESAERLDESVVSALVAAIEDNERGLILAGAMNPGAVDINAVLEVAAKAGWPILAEPTSQTRVASAESGAAVISTGSYLTRDSGFASRNSPEVILLLGTSPPHRWTQRWMANQVDCRVILIGNGPEWFDESLTFTDAFRVPPGELFLRVQSVLTTQDGREAWPRAWKEADEAATSAIRNSLIESDLFEGRVVTALAGVLPDDSSLYVGNSMSVRDVNLFWPRRDRPLDIYANRGASGIDGMVSSALGLAVGTGDPVILLVGDLSLLHDLSGLLAAVRFRVPLIIVVVNNDGGGIFSFLPVAEQQDAVRFRDLFHTPHGAVLGDVVAGTGAAHRLVKSSTELQTAVIDGLDGERPLVIEVQVDAAESVVIHRAVDAEVQTALSLLS